MAVSPAASGFFLCAYATMKVVLTQLIAAPRHFN
jgi:hypothetical protein